MSVSEVNGQFRRSRDQENFYFAEELIRLAILNDYKNVAANSAVARSAANKLAV